MLPSRDRLSGCYAGVPVVVDPTRRRACCTRRAAARARARPSSSTRTRWMARRRRWCCARTAPKSRCTACARPPTPRAPARRARHRRHRHRPRRGRPRRPRRLRGAHARRAAPAGARRHGRARSRAAAHGRSLQRRRHATSGRRARAVTLITADGDGEATLLLPAAATPGTIKHVIMVASTRPAQVVVRPSPALQDTPIVLRDAGDAATFLWTGTAWVAFH